MSKDFFERIGTLVPVDKQTALSTAKGFAYEPNKKITTREWEAPPELKFPRPRELNLTGVKYGRLTVIGLDANKVMGKHTAPSWVCRCTCGRYTSRSAKAIRNPNNQEDRCGQCLHVAYLQRQAKRLGTPFPSD
jgi:hypothetical protein